MLRLAATVYDGTVMLSDGRSLPLLTAAEELEGKRVWVHDIHAIPHALREVRLCDARTLAQVLAIDPPEESDAAALEDWVEAALDEIADEDVLDDLRLTVDQQRTWWRVLRRGFRIDREALDTLHRDAKYRRRLATMELGTDLLFDKNARAFLDAHKIRISLPDAEPDAPTTVSHKLWHRAEVPDDASDAWGRFRAVRESLTTFRKIEEIAANSGTGRVWTRWAVSGAVTGRMSSSAIPMQNIPKSVRHVFRADPGHVLLKCDLDRAEPSVAAWLSGDQQLADDLRNGDVYQSLADRIGVDRATAKVVLLALLYSKGERRLGFDLDISVREARQIKDDLLGAYPDLHAWMRRITRQAERGRGVTTGFGRHIPIPAKHAYRAVNYAAQGTAAGVLLGMIDEIVNHPMLGEETLWLAVHDEVLLQVPQSGDYRTKLEAFAECMRSEPAPGIRIAGTPEILGTHWSATE